MKKMASSSTIEVVARLGAAVVTNVVSFCFPSLSLDQLQSLHRFNLESYEEARRGIKFGGPFPNWRSPLPPPGDFLHALLTLLAILWLLIKLRYSYLLRRLSHTLLSSQALEYILVGSGDVEENPGPTYLTGTFYIQYPVAIKSY